MSTLLKTGLIQQQCDTDADANLAKSINRIREAASQGARLVVLQELHRTPYFCQTEDVSQFDVAERIPGPSTETLAALANELDIVIVASLFEKRAAGLYHNTAVVLDGNKGIVGRYRKMHIPDDPGYYEKFYFTPGDLGFEPIETSVGKLGVLVCWDQWYPEAARLMSLAGADILIYPTAIGWDRNDSAAEQQRQRDAWITIQRSHAIANGLPVLSCNRTGFEPSPEPGTDRAVAKGIDFWGSSFIAGPQGEILEQAPVDSEATLVATINLQHSENVRRIWPFLRDRRIDAYDDILTRFRD